MRVANREVGLRKNETSMFTDDTHLKMHVVRVVVSLSVLEKCGSVDST